MEYQNGASYIINHSRKGEFAIQVTGQDEEWLSGVIVAGKANAMLSYNEREEGEELTVRKSFISSAEQITPPPAEEGK